MKLIYAQNDIEVTLSEGIVTVLTVENIRVFRELLGELYLQIAAGTGNIVLSEKEKEFNLSKMVELIINPFSVNCNDKKIIGKIYQEIIDISNETIYEHIGEINSELVGFVDLLLQQVPYNLQMAVDLDIGGLLKLYDVRFDSMTDDLVNYLIDYIRIVHQVLKKEVFIFVNLKQYLTESELLGLYEFTFYEKVHLVIVEGSESERLANEKHLVLDKDLCWIGR